MNFTSPPPLPKHTPHASQAPLNTEKVSRGKWILLFIFVLIFTGIPLSFLLPSTSKRIETYFQTARWEITPCVVTQSELLENKDTDLSSEEEANRFSVGFAYEYSVGGKKFTAQRIGIERPKISGKFAEIYRWKDRHPVGEETTCIVNPDEPLDAFLERKFPWKAVGGCAAFFLTLVLGIIGVLWGMGLFSRIKRRRPIPPDSVSGNPFTANTNSQQPVPTALVSRKENQWILLVGGPIFCAMGIGLLYNAIATLSEIKKSKNWVETPCLILQSEVQSQTSTGTPGKHGHPSKTTYAIYTCYSYQWKGEKLISEKYDFSSYRSNNRDAKDAAVKRYPKGKSTVCYVNPDAPTEAVLVRNGGDMLRWMDFLFGSIFAVAGISIFIAYFFIGKKKVVYTNTASIPTALQVVKKPVRIFRTLLFTTVLWNGLLVLGTSIFIPDESPNWIWECIVVLLALAGIGLFIATVRRAFSAFGPKLMVTMKPVVRLGETVSLTWRIFDNPGDVHLLKLSLVCIAKVPGIGEGNLQGQHPIKTLELLELPGPLSANTGRLNVSFPLDASPCADAPVKIIWRIKAEIRHRSWPNQNWEFALEVIP